MENNMRPADMQRINTPELAQAFIQEQLEKTDNPLIWAIAMECQVWSRTYCSLPAWGQYRAGICSLPRPEIFRVS